MDGENHHWTNTTVRYMVTYLVSYQRRMTRQYVHPNLNLPRTHESQVGEPVDKNFWGELEPEEGTQIHLFRLPDRNLTRYPR